MVNKVNTDDRLDAIRDDEKTRVANILFGTDDAAPTLNDSGLGNEVASKAASNEDGATGEFTSHAKLTTAEANGNTIQEVGEEESDGTLLARIVHAGIDKTSSFELEARLTKTYQNP